MKWFNFKGCGTPNPEVISENHESLIDEEIKTCGHIFFVDTAPNAHYVELKVGLPVRKWCDKTWLLKSWSIDNLEDYPCGEPSYRYVRIPTDQIILYETAIPFSEYLELATKVLRNKYEPEEETNK